MEDLGKEDTNGMVINDDTHQGPHNNTSNNTSSLLHLHQQHHQQQQGSGGGGGGGLLQHPPRIGAAEAQYLEGLLREKESLTTSQGMDLARRLVSQGEHINGSWDTCP